LFAPLKGAKKMKVYQDALNILNTVDTFIKLKNTMVVTAMQLKREKLEHKIGEE